MPNTPMKEGYHEKAELSFTLFVGGKVLLSALILFTEGTSTTEEGTLESSWIFFWILSTPCGLLCTCWINLSLVQIHCSFTRLFFIFLFFNIFLDCF